MVRVQNEKGFTLISVLVGASIAAGATFLTVAAMLQNQKAQRHVASKAEATQFHGLLQLLTEDRCSCANSGLVGVDVNPASPASAVVGLGKPLPPPPGPPAPPAPPVYPYAEGKVFGMRKITSLRITEMVELQTLGSGNKIFWTTLSIKTIHDPDAAEAMSHADNYDLFQLPIKVEWEPIGGGPNGRIVGCYSIPGECEMVANVTSTPATANFFVTSAKSKGNMGGIAGANRICEDAARGANLVPYANWKAVIAVSGDHPSSRFATVSGRVVNTAGEQIAANVTDFFSNTHADEELFNEFGAPVVGSGQRDVWTGMRDQTSQVGATCNGWTSDDEDDDGQTGSSRESAAGWYNSGRQSCDDEKRLYCVKQ